MEPIEEDLILKRAHELARVCGCRNWRYHFGVARAQLVKMSDRGLVELVYGWRGNTRVITRAKLVRNLSGVAA